MRARGFITVAIVAGAVLCVAGCGVTPRGIPDDEAVTVRVEGFAPLRERAPIKSVRRQAVRDARRNAVMQAQVLLSTETRVDNGRLRGSHAYTRALGYIERMELIEAGRVPGSEPPLYRVTARATVRPTKRYSVAEALGWGRPAPWEPMAVLDAGGDLDEEARNAIAGALKRTGVLLTEQGGESPALIVRLRATSSEAEGEHSVAVEWTVFPRGEESNEETERFRGQWRGRAATAPPARWWNALGTVVAQDVIRAWVAPRPTVLRFAGLMENQKATLAVLAREGRAQGVAVEEVEEGLVLRLTVSGDPVTVAEMLVERAELGEALALSSARLGEVVYRSAHR